LSNHTPAFLRLPNPHEFTSCRFRQNQPHHHHQYKYPTLPPPQLSPPGSSTCSRGLPSPGAFPNAVPKHLPRHAGVWLPPPQILTTTRSATRAALRSHPGTTVDQLHPLPSLYGEEADTSRRQVSPTDWHPSHSRYPDNFGGAKREIRDLGSIGVLIGLSIVDRTPQNARHCACRESRSCSEGLSARPCPGRISS